MPHVVIIVKRFVCMDLTSALSLLGAISGCGIRGGSSCRDVTVLESISVVEDGNVEGRGLGPSEKLRVVIS